MSTTKAFIATALFITAGATHAGPEYVDPAEGFQSTRTRAEVIEELRQARAEGMRTGSESYPGETELLARARLAGDKHIQTADQPAEDTMAAKR